MRTLKNFLLDLFFPKNCFGCQKEETYLCEDCVSLLDIINFHETFKTENLDDLYFALSYKNHSLKYEHRLIKLLIKRFKYNPFVKSLSHPLSSLIITHFNSCEKQISFIQEKTDFIIVPIPLNQKRLKWRGFNQAEEIAKNLSEYLQIPLCNNALIKNKETYFQSNLSKEARESNLLNSFSCNNQIKNKKILLVDDIYTTGSTMEECSKTLKKAGAIKVIGITIARTG